MERKKIIKTLFISLFVFVASSRLAAAATLFVSPASGTYGIGQNFSVSVYVGSADQAMNAASGKLSFPADKVEVLSVSKNGSIFNLWVQEPSISGGVVNFEGIVLNPGFTGVSGKIITVNLKGKSAGNAPLTFDSASILANDGSGTNILTGTGNGSIVILGGESPSPFSQTQEAEVQNQDVGELFLPKISSQTHPDPDKWYKNNKPVLAWTLPAGTTAVKLLVGKIPNAVPTILYSSAITKKDLEGLEDGIWYFHVQAKTKSGWGRIAHFKFQIDTSPPTPFSVVFPHGDFSEDPRPIIYFNTTDSISGISHYEVKIGEKDFWRVDLREIDSNPYALPLQGPGKKTVIVKALDKAGNENTAIKEFEIKSLESPKITSYPKVLQPGEILIVEGETYPDTIVTILLKNKDGEVMSRDAKSWALGRFEVIWPKPLASGVYVLSARVTDNREAQSFESAPLEILVKRSKFITVGGEAITALSVVVPIAALGFLAIFLFWYGRLKMVSLRKILKKKTHNIEFSIHKAFAALKEEIEEHVKLLEKTKSRRELTTEEEKILKQLKKNLDNTEKSLRKEIEDIEEKIG